MLDRTPYRPLDAGTLAERLGSRPDLTLRLGEPEGWRVREVGDGNLNLVFIVEGEEESVVVKQALPYARVVGESWPMTLDRSYYEYHALTRLGARDPDRLPEVFAFDEVQALVVMEHLSPHVIARKALIAGERLPHMGRHLGLYLARTLFRGSDLSMDTARRKADLALFAGNGELCGITEDLVFTDPFMISERNRHTPGLEADAAAVRADRDLKLAAHELKLIFGTRAESLLHGDLHTGSVMVTRDDTRVIDAEFAVYGPMGFDVGMLLGNLWLSAFAQAGLGECPQARAPYAAWILETAQSVWQAFTQEFSLLWRTERTGMLGGRGLFEEQGDEMASELALARRLTAVWQDALGFAGLEMHRRILGLAHIAEFEQIADEAVRAACERRALRLGRELMLHRADGLTMAQVNGMAMLLAGGRP